MFRSLSELSELNPNFQCPSTVELSDPVSFIPMGDVSDSGHWTTRRTRPLKSVRQGFTPFANGDVLFAKITPCMENGKGAHVMDLANGVGFGSTEFHVLRPKPGADARFIFHHTQHRELRFAAEAAMTGSAGQKRVPTEFFRKWKIYAPGKEEQARIAQILDILDTQIQKTETLIAKLEKIKEGVLYDLLTRGIDQKGQLRPAPDQAPELYREGGLNMIPINWRTASLRELSSIIIDGTHYTPTYVESGVPFLRVTNLHHRDINLSKFKYISEREHKILSARCNPERGDILLSKNGTVGIAKMVSWDWDFSIFVSLALIRFKDDSGILPQFAELVINSPIVAKQIAVQSKQGTVTNLHLEEIRKFTVPIPDLHEQQCIVSELSKLSTRINKEIDQHEKLLTLKQGLAEDLLSGRVRVTPLLKDAV